MRARYGRLAPIVVLVGPIAALLNMPAFGLEQALSTVPRDEIQNRNGPARSIERTAGTACLGEEFAHVAPRSGPCDPLNAVATETAADDSGDSGDSCPIGRQPTRLSARAAAGNVHANIRREFHRGFARSLLPYTGARNWIHQ